jgi:hypothetical protein
VTGLIDLEGATLAPTWRAAQVPAWIPDPGAYHEHGGAYDVHCAESRVLWDTFHATMDVCSPEWRAAHEQGAAARALAEACEWGVGAWGREENLRWVEECTPWLSDAEPVVEDDGFVQMQRVRRPPVIPEREHDESFFDHDM